MPWLPPPDLADNGVPEAARRDGSAKFTWAKACGTA